MRFISTLFTILLLTVASNSNAQEDGLVLSKEKTKLLMDAQAYLSSIKTLKANFIQTNPDGLPISEGQFFIDKPGKLVLKYTRPFNIYYYIIDDSFIQYDADLDQVTRASAPDNPLRVLLYDDITFYDNNIMDIGGIKESPDSFSVYLASKSDDYTEISGLILRFSKGDTELTGIQRVDAEGNYTNLQLTGLKKNEEIDKSIFEFSKPSPKYPSSRN